MRGFVSVHFAFSAQCPLVHVSAMQLLLNQRWRARRHLYRPAGEIISTHRYEVAEIPDDLTAKGFVLAHHYSASYPAARFRIGLLVPKASKHGLFDIPLRLPILLLRPCRAVSVVYRTGTRALG